MNCRWKNKTETKKLFFVQLTVYRFYEAKKKISKDVNEIRTNVH